MSRGKWPLPLGLPGLRVTELEPYSRTDVYCTECDWTQPGRPGFHLIRASSIRQHLADHPGHVIEAKVRGIERFTLDPHLAAQPHEMPREGTNGGEAGPS